MFNIEIQYMSAYFLSLSKRKNNKIIFALEAKYKH